MELQQLQLTWYGHSTFSFVSPTGLKVLIDPWFECPTAPQHAKTKVMEEGVDLILITHGHSDHIGNAVEIAKNTGAKIVAIYEVMLFLGSQGVPQEQLVGMNKGGTYRENDLRATMVNAEHSSGIDFDGKVLPGGEAAGFIIRFDNGFTMYHTGDTCLFAGLEELITERYQPQLLMLPIGDLFTMGPEEAAIFVQKVRPQYIVPMHWGTFPLLTGTPQALKDFLAEDDKDKVIVLEPGDVVTTQEYFLARCSLKLQNSLAVVIPDLIRDLGVLKSISYRGFLLQCRQLKKIVIFSRLTKPILDSRP